jgi:NADPH2:quinone reductase
MKAWLVGAWGEPESMAFAEADEPAPGPNQVRIRTRAAGLNFFDILQVQGKYQIKPPFPFTPGAEVAGVIDALGDSVTSFALGQSVMAIVQLGGMADAAIANVSQVFPIPPGMDFAMAAGMPIVYQTGWYALRDRAALVEGEWLLVHAGASGVGVAAIHLGRAFGARVIATAGSPDKLQFALAQGAHHVISYQDESWVDQVKQLTGGRGADVIYDPVGGDVFDLSTKCIASQGRLLVIGFASGRIPSIAANRILIKNISVIGALWGVHSQTHPEAVAQAQRSMSDMFIAGALRPAEPQTFPLEDAPRALRALAERQVLGKAVLLAS